MPADHFGVGQADACDAQAVDQPRESGMGGVLCGLYQVFIGFFPEALHGDNGVPVMVQMEDIGKFMDEPGGNEFFQGHF